MSTLKNLIASFPRFNGSTDVEEFIEKFKANLIAHSKDEKWAVTMFCHFLDATAQVWWARQEVSYLVKINVSTVSPAQVLDEIFQNLSTSFPVSQFRQSVRSAARSRKFLQGEPAPKFLEEMQMQIQTEKSSHEETLSSSLRSQMSQELDNERQKFGTQMSDLQSQHAKDLEHEKQRFEAKMKALRSHHDKELENKVQQFDAEVKELRSRHDREMEEIELKLENEVQQRRTSLHNQKERELEASQRQTQEEFLKELDDLKVHLHKEHDQLREEMTSQMKIQHDKDMKEMVLKLKQDFFANEANVLKQQYQNELNQFASDLQQQLSVEKLSLNRKHNEEMARLEKEETEQENRNSIKTDAWVQQQNEERELSKGDLARDRERSGEQFYSLLHETDPLDQLGNLETIKNDDDSNRTTATYDKNSVALLEKTVREAWLSRGHDVVSVDNYSAEHSSDDRFPDSFESDMQKSFRGKSSKSLKRARHFPHERIRATRIGHGKSWRLKKSVDELAARLNEEARLMQRMWSDCFGGENAFPGRLRRSPGVSP